MKKTFGIFLIAISFFTTLKSQTFSVTPNRTQTGTAPCTGSLGMEAYVINNGTTDLWLSYNLVINTLPDIACWTQTYCDCNICMIANIIPNADDCHGWGQNLTPIAPGDTGLIMSVHIDNTNGYYGSGSIQYAVYETGNTSNRDTVTFNITGCTTGVACSVGIEENLLDQVIVYPTLVSDKINIEANANISSIESLVIYDCIGKVVYTESNIEFVANKKSLDASQLPNGVYFIRLGENDYSSVKKIVKNN